MLVSFFYQILLVIGDPILLGGSIMGYEVLGQSGLGDIFIGHGADGYFILYESHGL